MPSNSTVLEDFIGFPAKDISLCDCHWTRRRNHLVCKRTLNHLGKLAK